MSIIENIKERFQQTREISDNKLGAIEQYAFENFRSLGIPTSKNEEWKYTRVSTLFNKDYQLITAGAPVGLSAEEMDPLRLPGHENANELVFVNGQYSGSLSVIRSNFISVLPLKEAAENEYAELVSKHLGSSAKYVKDGIYELNTSFIQGGIFIMIKPGRIIEEPVHIYHVTDARNGNILAQPRSLIYVSERAQVMFAETYITLGSFESFTNQVAEVIVEKDAVVEYYKIQSDTSQSNQVSTTHFGQTGKSHVHTVTVSLNGGMVRNNLSIALEAEHSEAHLHGLYFLKGGSHVDNHTVVDNVKPNCHSNELYKGVIDDAATAVFNGKIFVRQPAQKTNAYQSNKNLLLSENASVNTKPQLEIFADDVKCSHGCTVGQLDEEAFFYLRSRGISEKKAKSLLIHAFAVDILDHIKPEPLRNYIDQLISERLEYNMV
jgi:Fe-S cluster assembly protein SufD